MTDQTPTTSQGTRAWASKTIWASFIVAAAPLVWPRAAGWIAENPQGFSALLGLLFTVLRLVTNKRIDIA